MMFLIQDEALNIFQLPFLNMYSSKQNRMRNKVVPQQTKKERPKQVWSTDFMDRQQFKLSEAEMIQKKAALQSKHRQLARQQLQQRRRKLEMGIIDDQTRKIYQTALTSKNIDINPPVRRNLTEMIRYQKQIRQKGLQDEYCDQESQNQEDFDELAQSQRDIRQAQNFIKKFERAKKQDKIQRAVQILTNNKPGLGDKQRNNRQPNTCGARLNNYMDYVGQDDAESKQSRFKQNNQPSDKSLNQDDAISSIQDTIRFMEEKLFAAKKTVQQHSRSFINQTDQSFQAQTYKNRFAPGDGFKANLQQKGDFRKQNRDQSSQNRDQSSQNRDQSSQDCIQFTTKQKQLVHQQDELQLQKRMAQISQLRIKLQEEQIPSSDDQCLNTIRRMRELMQNQQFSYEEQSKKMKQNIRDNATPSALSLQYDSTICKNYRHYGTQSEAQVSFSLTMNNDAEYQQQAFQSNAYRRVSDDKAIAKPTLFQTKQNNLKPSRQVVPNRTKQDQYEQQYQKIKQNLFRCIDTSQQAYTNNKKASNPHQSNTRRQYEDEQEQDQSDDSLMVKDKINSWKMQLQHQVEPEQQQKQQVDLKMTAYGKKPQFTTSRALVKQQQDQEQQDQDESYYRYNYVNQKSKSIRNSNKNSQEQSEHSNFSHTNKSIANSMSMSRPPMMKKNHQNDNKFQQIRKMISNASNQIQRIQIQPLRIQPLNPTGQVVGFDFRDSINLKRNILSK